MTRWRPLLVAASLVAAHEILERVCDRAELTERMLSPGGGGLALAALATASLFALRLGVIFVLPGWLLARGIEVWRARRAPPSAP